MNNKRKVITITLIFVTVLTLIRLGWIYTQQPIAHPAPVEGYLDLRDWDFQSARSISLDGEWEFYPGVLLMQGMDLPTDYKQKLQYIHVPGNWDKELDNSRPSTYGYGSYRLRIAINPDMKLAYGIRVNYVLSSSALFVNGQPLNQSGQPAEEPEQGQAKNLPYSAFFLPKENEIEVVIQVANYEHPLEGGIVKPIKFGSAEAVSKEVRFSEDMQLLVAAILMLHALYAAIIYWIGPHQKLLIYFFLLVLSATLMTVCADDRLLLVRLQLDYIWNLKISYLSIIGSSGFLLLFVRALLPFDRNTRINLLIGISYGILAFLILVLPIKPMHYLKHIITLFYLAPFCIVPVYFMKAVLKDIKDSVFLLLAAVAITVNVLWGMVKTPLNLEFYPFDFIITFLALGSFWFKRYFRNAHEMELLANKLQKLDKLKDDFLTNTSHELRNPLHGMLNIAQSMLENHNSSLSREDIDHLELLLSIGKRMSYQVNDLLDLSLLQDKKLRLRLETVHIQATVAGVIDMLSFMVENKPIRIINRIPHDLPPILADENRFVQILFNLLHNAMKYTDEGTITFSAKLKNGRAVVSIEDTGIGMDERTLQHIFQPYEQAHTNLSASSGGIGLGLSISKQLIELHEGEITVRSTPGHGSTFSITLRLAPDADAGSTTRQSWLTMPEVDHSWIDPSSTETGMMVAGTIEDPASASAGLQSHEKDNIRILAVDDELVNLKILKQIFVNEPYEITTALSGAEALAVLESKDWDLIITDVMMPQMSGYELTRIVRERYSLSEIPILLLTARARPEDIAAGFRAGANDYVLKPVEALELRSRVKALTMLKQSVRDHLRLEMACLQAQIQPHFLFNTLNSISALSEIDLARMRSLLGEFGNYLRSSFAELNAERLVPLSHEIQLVRSYLYIEQERFGERLNVEWEIDERLNLQLPPLSIQPLVENAVRHGIMARASGGTIRIRIADEEDKAVISIHDNGVGIEKERAQRLLDTQSPIHTGVGLRNTDRRLKQIYGSGLLIQSEQGCGTTVSFKVSK